MSKPNSRHIIPRPDNTWANQRAGAERAGSVHDTQQGAINAAREMLRNQGGGELNIHGKNMQIRAKDTVPHGNDPCPPKG